MIPRKKPVSEMSTILQKTVLSSIPRLKFCKMATMSTMREAKTKLRKEMKAKIKSLPMENRIAQSKSVTEKLLKLPEFQRSQSLSLYLHMPDEIQTEDILVECLKLGKKCFIPRYFGGGNLMEMVLLKDLQDYDSLPRTKWNIKQPPDEEVREEALEHHGGLDLMLVPGMAFTRDGKRLGRGKGYYDTYLSKAKKSTKMPVTIALAFDEQILDDIPVSDHDFVIDKVLTSS